MDVLVSPLVQDARPSFRPKVAQLYEELFQVCASLSVATTGNLTRYQDGAEAVSDGYWSEFFLLKPDRRSLQQRLDAVDADSLLHFQYETQQLFTNAVHCLKTAKAPSDEFALEVSSLHAMYLYLTLTEQDPNSLLSWCAVEAIYESKCGHYHSTCRLGRGRWCVFGLCQCHREHYSARPKH
jgi:hypothetical protein